MKYKYLILVSLLSAILASLITIIIIRYMLEPQVVILEENNNKAHYTSHKEASKTEHHSFIPTIQKTKPSVVAIKAISEKQAQSNSISIEMGSGVLFSPEGYIVTNYHVIKNADHLDIKLLDKREYKAKVIGYDEATDLAIIKIDETNLSHIVFGNSDSLDVGEWVLAIGNPYRLQSSVTAGIVSAKARDINILEQSGIESFIQTDAAINKGNSGGALIDTDGKLVGINTAIVSESGRYEGFSFAIPVNLVKKVVYDLLEYGAVQRGWLGIALSDVDDNIAKQSGMNSIYGVKIDLVEKNSAASEAGLLKDDIITTVNDMDANTSPEFMEIIAQYSPGDELKLTIIRDGSTIEKNIVLRNFLNTTEIVIHSSASILKDIGLDLRNLTEEELKLSQGVKVISILSKSKIHDTNMQAGFIITHLNKKEVKNITEFVSILKEEEGVIILEGIYEDYPGHFPYQFVK